MKHDDLEPGQVVYIAAPGSLAYPKATILRVVDARRVRVKRERDGVVATVAISRLRSGVMGG